MESDQLMIQFPAIDQGDSFNFKGSDPLINPSLYRTI